MIYREIAFQELQPVTSVTSVTWSCPLPMGAAGRFKVHAKHVAVRAHPELHGKVRNKKNLAGPLAGISHPGYLKCVINVFNI